MTGTIEYKLEKLLRFDDDRGSIVVLEKANMPFDVRRLFFTFHTNGVRGRHAHKKTEQLLICVKGSLKVKLKNARFEVEVKLQTPELALYIPKMTWTELHEIAENSIILVLASEPYENIDYIGSFDLFLKTAEEER